MGNNQNSCLGWQQSKLQVTPDSVTVLVKSHADIGHSEPVTNMAREAAKNGRGWGELLLTVVLIVITRSQHL